MHMHRCIPLWLAAVALLAASCSSTTPKTSSAPAQADSAHMDAPSIPPTEADPPKINVTKTAKGVRSFAFKYLVAHQNDDGSYGAQGQSKPTAGTTALTLYAFASSQRGYRPSDGPFMSKAVKYLLARQNRDGSFGSSRRRIWETRMAVLALEAIDAQKHGEAIAAAKPFLASHPKDAVHQPGNYEQLWMETLTNTLSPGSGPGTAWFAKTIAWLKGKQDLADGVSDSFGSFRCPKYKALEGDPIIATAFAGLIADRIKDKYKEFKKHEDTSKDAK